MAIKKKRKSKVDRPCDFVIENHGDYFLLRNIKMEFTEKSGHTHLEKYQTCEDLINWICNHTVPYKGYLRESARRVSRDEKYLEMIDIKNSKMQDKQRYFNVNNGCACQ